MDSLIEYKKPYLVAEIGCNHKGDIRLAKKMIKIAAQYCKVDAVKFQKRNPRELLTPAEYSAPHPNPIHAYGHTYGEHREYLELTIEEHHELQRYCRDLDVEYSSSVWDMTSARQIAALNPKMIKIPSAQNTNYEMLTWLSRHYLGQIHLSTGMTTVEELEQIIELVEREGRLGDVVLYACTSAYPVQPGDICLLEIKELQKKYGSRVHGIAFSGHHQGRDADIAAYTLGTEIIERHFTLDRDWKGTDHHASLDADGMCELSRALDDVYAALNYKGEEILEIEKSQRQKLKFNPLSVRRGVARPTGVTG